MSERHLSVLITLLLLGGLSVAQSLPDAPGISDTPAITVGSFPPAQQVGHPFNHGAIAAAEGPLIEPTVADAHYWASTLALVGTTIANVELTARCSERHTCLTEISPGSTRATLYAYTLPTDLILSCVSYKLKKTTRWWMVPQLVFTGANLFSAGRSYGRLQ
jgi:hypothetical protein